MKSIIEQHLHRPSVRIFCFQMNVFPSKSMKLRLRIKTNSKHITMRTHKDESKIFRTLTVGSFIVCCFIKLNDKTLWLQFIGKKIRAGSPDIFMSMLQFQIPKCSKVPLTSYKQQNKIRAFDKARRMGTLNLIIPFG